MEDGWTRVASTDPVLDYEVAIRNAAYTVPASTSKAVCPLYSMYLEKRSVHSPGINIKGCLSIILNVSGETQRTQSRHQHQRQFVCIEPVILYRVEWM
jgi:hypothetical protein